MRANISTGSLGLSFFGMGLLALSVVACDESKPKEAPKSTATTALGSATAKPSAETPPPNSPPKSLGKLKVPDDNPVTDAKVALGHQLFFDKRLSADGSRSCYSCHQNEDGTGGHDAMAVGAKEKQLTRHAPTMWNVAYLPKLYWDGRADSLEAQALGAWGGGNMGVGKENLEAKAQEIGKIPGYAKQFKEVFGGEATPDRIAQAISSYERTLFCADTAWDKYTAGDKSAMNSEQTAGWQLFIGKASCNTCHTPPFFSDAFSSKDSAFHNTGVGVEGKKKEEVDIGRKQVTKTASEWAAFKTPSLRNVTKSPPYFHDGSEKSLEAAVRFMAGGGFKNEHLDTRLADRELSDAEIKQLVAFLGALECGGTLTEPKLPE